MNDKRAALVKQAFQKIDKDGSGVLDLTDIRGVYDPSGHPDVKSGKRTPDDVLGEFLDTFEMNHALNGEGLRDRKVT